MISELASNMTNSTILDRKIKVEVLLYEIEMVMLCRNMFLSLSSLRLMAE